MYCCIFNREFTADRANKGGGWNCAQVWQFCKIWDRWWLLGSPLLHKEVFWSGEDEFGCVLNHVIIKYVFKYIFDLWYRHQKIGRRGYKKNGRFLKRICQVTSRNILRFYFFNTRHHPVNVIYMEKKQSILCSMLMVYYTSPVFPLSWIHILWQPAEVYVRAYESRMDLLRAVIIGAEGTPYHDGLFFFDVHFPSNYPNVPPVCFWSLEPRSLCQLSPSSWRFTTCSLFLAGSLLSFRRSSNQS